MNHVHAVWRDFSGDFGRDLLADHYKKKHKPRKRMVSMFDGKTLKGWKPNENEDSFWVKDGCIVANAPEGDVISFIKQTSLSRILNSRPRF